MLDPEEVKSMLFQTVPVWHEGYFEMAQMRIKRCGRKNPGASFISVGGESSKE